MKRYGAVRWLGLISLLTMPIAAWGQAGPPTFTGPLSGPRPEENESPHAIYLSGHAITNRVKMTILETCERRSYCFVGLEGVSYAGVHDDHYLFATPIGAFSASLDAVASLLGSGGVGVGIHWYAWEGVTTSLRWDFIQRRLSVTMTLIP